MKHLTLFERQFIAKAAFDWYTQHGYNAELSYFHGASEYRLVIYLHDGEALPKFDFLDHPDIERIDRVLSPEISCVKFVIPYDRC